MAKSLWFNPLKLVVDDECLTLVIIFARLLVIRIHQLPVSASRWQHVPPLCFAAFIGEKCLITTNSTTTQAREKISSFGIL